MKNNEVKMRAFGTGCFYEFEFANGKNLLLDPFLGFKPEELTGHDRDEVTSADYILLTHSHFDHDKDLGYYARKYNSAVIAPAFSATAVYKYHKLTSDQIFCALPGATLEFDDISVEVLPTKHSVIKDVYDPDKDISFEMHGISGHKECDHAGSLESVDYLVTTQEGFKIMIASGMDVLNNTINATKKSRPNVLLRQMFGKYDAKTHIDYFARYNAELICPMHYDSLRKNMGSEEAYQSAIKEISDGIRDIKPGCQFFLPEPWKWYNLGFDISEC